MHKDDRYYTFLLTHTSKSKVYIRRVEISKKFIRNTAASIALTFGIASVGILGFLNLDSRVFAKNENSNAFAAAISNQTSAKKVQPTENQAFNYDRPDSADVILNNAGGPTVNNLNAEDSDAENADVDAQLRVIETTSNPQNIPNVWAHLGKINNEFGFRRNPFGGRSYEFHAGMDIDGERGDGVIAPAAGTVTKAGWQGGYGNMIEIDHGNGLTTRYGHLSKVEVAVGDPVQRGQLIGAVGSTGRSTGPHLHYELRLNDRAINPRRFLPPEPTDIAALSKQ
jgi:murein DD-endopeptidase MepM/ murein hydrolase activator NlpD